MLNSGNKAVFLDRDGVINVERGTYTFHPEDFLIIDGVHEALKLLKRHEFTLVVVTNQSGIAQGLFTRSMMLACHEKLNKATENLIDAIYYAPWHPSVTESLTRKPDTLLLEKAIARFNININASWLIGDRERDIEAGNKIGVKTIYVRNERDCYIANEYSDSLLHAVNDIILK